MTETETHHICTLMCMVILADERVFLSEIETFTKTLNSLQRATRTDDLMTEDMARDWFADNRFQIEAVLESTNKKKQIADLFKALGSFEFKGALLEALALIASADQELHANEVDIVRIGAQVWNREIPERLS